MFDNIFLKTAIDSKLLTVEQLEKAREESVLQKKSLIDILVQQNIITNSDFVKFLAEKTNKPYLEKLTESMIDPDLLLKVPFKFLKQNFIMLINYKEKPTALLVSPKYLDILDDLYLIFSGNIEYGFAPEELISESINRYYPFTVGQEAIDELKADSDSFDLDEIKAQDIVEMANDAPIVKLVNHIIFKAIKENASDIHIELFEKELRVRFRIDGNMYYKFSPPKRYHGAIISRIKIMSTSMNIAEKRMPQDGRIQIKVADKSYDLRISILPCNYGERVSMRILDKSRGVTELEKINLSERDYNLLIKTIGRPNGIILVSGPTGSGKTTTLYSILNRLNNEDTNIITVEDPVEYTIAGINQVQVNVKTGLTFSSALRSILRQDPDVALIGEIRDAETAKISTEAALTGHLVLSTIHTNSAPGTITRLIEMGVEPFLIASSLICVIAQRLVRALCASCKIPFSPSVELLEKFNISVAQNEKILFYKANGCNECFGTGHKGRIPIFEIMEVTESIASLIVKQASVIEIQKQAILDGMTILAQDGIRKVKQGLTTVEEVASVAFVEN